MQEMLYPTSYLGNRWGWGIVRPAHRRPISPVAPPACPSVTPPEAADGGAIGLVEEGDTIEIDIPNRRIHLAVTDGVLAERRAAMEAKGDAAWKPVARSASSLLPCRPTP